MRRLIFFHLAKTGGITLRRIAERHLPEGYAFYNLSLNQADSKELEEFRALPETKKEKIAVLAGHMPFGMDKELSGPSDYITMLRNPLDIVVSEYYYLHNSPLKDWHRAIADFKAMSLGDFARSGFNITTNHQTRVLARIWSTFLERSVPVDEAAFSRAKESLRRDFLCVGITERFDESLLVMKRRLGWRSIYYFRENKTPGRRPTKSIAPGDRDAILERNHIDLALWKFANELLDKEIEDYGPNFMRDLRHFQRRNFWYQKARRVALLARGLMFRLKKLTHLHA